MLMYPLFFIEHARKRKFARRLQAKAVPQKMSQLSQFTKEILLGRREFTF
jgi:hypothetical protein